MNFKLKLYKNKVNRVLRNIWFKSMKPIAFIITKIEDKKYKTEQDEINKIVNSIDEDDAINRLFDVMLRDFAKYPGCEWPIFVAEHDSWDDGIKTIKYYMINQKYDKYLKSWAYRIPFNSFDINRVLTYKFKDKVLGHGAFETKFVEHRVYGQKYENTLVIALNEQYLKLFTC